LQHVQLDVSAEPSQLSLPRLVVGAVASRIDMPVDLIEDLQLSMDELCVSVMADESSAKERLDIVVSWSEHEVRIEVTSHGESVAPLVDGVELTAFSQQILDALVDEHGVDVRDGSPVRWLRLAKRTDAGAA
jgi:hypothetical protein